MKNQGNDKYIIKEKEYTELTPEEAAEHGIYDPDYEPRPKFHTPALVDGEPAWVIDSSNMYMQEMINWREQWECADFDHGLDPQEFLDETEEVRRAMARYLVVDCNPDFDSVMQTYYTEDTVNEVIDIIVGVWEDRAREELE